MWLGWNKREAGGGEDERRDPSPLPLPGAIEEAPEDQLLDDAGRRSTKISDQAYQIRRATASASQASSGSVEQ